jgi:hypothetical protein
MAATGYTPIILYNSTTASNVPTTGNLQAGELALNIADGKLYFNQSGTITTLASSAVNNHLSWSAANNTLTVTGTGSLQVPNGTTAQEPATPAAGMLRFNSDTNGFEGYNGSLWGGIGGAQAGGAIVTNNKSASSSYTITTIQNGFSVGPITIASGVTITVATDSRWVII